MKKRLFTLLYIIATLSTTVAFAQSSGVKKASKSVIKVSTFNADGTPLASAYGAFIDENGIAIAALSPFKGASSAKVTDATGKEYDVDCLYGANDMYNVVKLKIKSSGKIKIVSAATEQSKTAVGGETWVAGFDTKAPQLTKLSVHSVEDFNGTMPYYILEQENNTIGDAMVGSPVFNAQGELMGLVNTTNYRTDLHVACARFAQAFVPSALTANENALRSSRVRVALPSDYNQAVLAMMVASQRNDSVTYPNTIEEFISLFPDKEDGYIYKATNLAGIRDFAGADAAMVKAIEVTDNKANAHYSFSKLIYDKETLMADVPFEAWSLDKAMTEIDAAIAITSAPLYTLHKGKVFYAQKKYEEALALFKEVNTGDMHDPEVFFYAYQSLKGMNAEQDKQFEMLDSACVNAPANLLYHTEKALLYLKMGRAPESIALCQQIINAEPRYAAAHGVLGLALCMVNRKETGVAELKRAKLLGYPQADEFIEKYGK